MTRIGISLLIALFLLTTFAQQAKAQDDKRIEEPDIIIEVGGLACPFCAYGVEKRLKKIDAIAELTVLLKEGTVQLKLKEGASVSEQRLRKAVADAGFKAVRIVFVNEKAKAPSVG